MIDFFKNTPDEVNLEKRFLGYACITSMILCVFALVSNILSGLDSSLNILCIISFIFFIGCFKYSKKQTNFKIVSNIFSYGIIVLLDLFYFYSGGIDSSMTSILIIAFLVLTLVSKNSIKNLSILLVFYGINLLAMFWLEVSFPALLTHYKSIEEKQMDLILSFFMALGLVTPTVYFFKMTYESFLKKIEDKNLKLIKSEQAIRKEKEMVEEATRAKSDFLSVMSHEIRTPLNAIVSISNLLLDAKHNRDDNLVLNLKYSADNLLALVSDILDFNKIESGEIKLEQIPFDINKLAKSVESVYSIKAKERRNIIKISLENISNNCFFGDSLRLNQILVNLISNAIKFTKDGTITIKIIEKSKTSEFTELMFEVIDTGVGIAKEKQHAIFEKFIQEDTTITRKYGGSGLGLTITKKLIELMDSEIKVESELGKGSKFYFSLKLKPAPEMVQEKKEIISDLSKLNLLLVEDNKMNVMVTTKFFDRWGIKYEVAENGLIALKKYEPKKFNLIFMDLQMPEMDGFTATQEIRKIDKFIPIVALTANSLADEKERCLNSGFDDYITKPFKPDLLKEKIISLTSS